VKSSIYKTINLRGKPMTFETKEQVLEKILDQEKPKCPHCGKEMNLWEVPSIPMGDGLGWGEPYLFVCFNDECPLYTQGWDQVEEDYGHKASYRSICYPSSGKFECLAGCYVEKDAVTVLRLLLDATEPARVRLKAAEMIGDIGGLEALELIINVKFGNELIQKEVDKAIKKIHEKYYTRECPFCAEIIKKRAKICKHCGKEVAGL
jgi:ribosomal protein L37AE/L43A